MFPKDRSTFNKFLIYSSWDEKELNKIDKETLDVITVKDVEHYFYRYEGSIKGIERFWSLVYLIYNFLETERYKSNVKENLGAILDKIKIKNRLYNINGGILKNK